MLRLVKPNENIEQIRMTEYSERIEKKETIFKVEQVQIETDTGKFITRRLITRDGIPEYQVNDFLLDKGLKKKTTGYTYAYSIIKLLKFLEKRNIEYADCTQFQARQYVRSLVYGEMEDLRIKDEKNKVTYSTLSTDITVMTEFFKFMKDEQMEIQMDIKYKKKAKKKAFLYGQIFEYNYAKIVERNIGNLKPSRRYIKWYEEDEKDAISSNFTSLRDKVIFLLTLEGMRIDEVLSLQMSGIDDIEQTVQPSRSKRKKDLKDGDDEIRIVSLPTSTYELLNNYLMTERADAEGESGLFTDDVFINLRKGNNQGKVLKYHNYLKILKDAARRGELDRKMIRTHSGRSTKVNELLEHQVLYPEDLITDEIIRGMLGWKNSDSIEPYKNRGNRVIAKAAAEKVYRRKAEKDMEKIKEEIKNASDKIHMKKEQI